jgi:hypothetical protein
MKALLLTLLLTGCSTVIINCPLFQACTQVFP